MHAVQSELTTKTKQKYLKDLITDTKKDEWRWIQVQARRESCGIHLKGQQTGYYAVHTCRSCWTPTVMRKQKGGRWINISCHQAVKIYNRFMGGIDKSDQLRGYYKVSLKSIKNYKYIFWFLFDMCITNAYILLHYNVNSHQLVSQSLKTFRMKLGTQLIGTYKSLKHAGRPSSTVTELLPPTLPRLEYLPARGDISRRWICCQKKTCALPTEK